MRMRAAFCCACPDAQVRGKGRVRPAGGLPADLIMRAVVPPASRFRQAVTTLSIGKVKGIAGW